ncbi:MAG: acyl-CoA dehydrogenase [Bacillota bacterium]|uniref:Acyl-CoA dehydrogenase n=1 Tax=Thermanaerosceptrum fracticalcis TaxID=1712410 RepID=A0A7G6E2G1_THEFR|nr:acyl-CoA dehydrogenase [Thermanaerosceptrum fracticalcis]QNB46265.1 acyl-CoA dehydrogenase [Thermanaerosceptrum fracticalcis]
MEFSLSPKHEMLRTMYREFSEKELVPIAAQIDETMEFPFETVKKMAELGFMGIPYPKEYGGAAAGDLAYILAVEEISRACASHGVTLSVHISLCCWPIYKYGNQAQKEKYLIPLASGKKLGAFGLTEPNAGTDASGLQTRAVFDGDEYVLNGSKIFITNGGIADVYVVQAVTDPGKGLKGISSFIVEKGTPGFTFGKKENKMGIRGSVQTELIFQDCRIPKENLLGQEGDGFKIAMTTLDGGRIGIGAQALGIAQAALEEAVKYSKERIQFNKPIANNQAIQWMIADMATEIDAARFLVYRAAWLKENNKPYSKEAAMAKLFASETAMRASHKAVQIHGGYGFIKEYRVERLMRDAKITEIYEGTSEVQRMVIAGATLK